MFAENTVSVQKIRENCVWMDILYMMCGVRAWITCVYDLGWGERVCDVNTRNVMFGHGETRTT